MERSAGAFTVAPERTVKFVVEAFAANVFAPAPRKVVVPSAEPPVIVPESVCAVELEK